MIAEYLDQYLGKYLGWLINPTASLLSKIVGDKYSRDAAWILWIAIVIIVAVMVVKKYKK